VDAVEDEGVGALGVTLTVTVSVGAAVVSCAPHPVMAIRARLETRIFPVVRELFMSGS